MQMQLAPCSALFLTWLNFLSTAQGIDHEMVDRYSMYVCTVHIHIWHNLEFCWLAGCSNSTCCCCRRRRRCIELAAWCVHIYCVSKTIKLVGYHHQTWSSNKEALIDCIQAGQVYEVCKYKYYSTRIHAYVHMCIHAGHASYTVLHTPDSDTDWLADWPIFIIIQQIIMGGQVSQSGQLSQPSPAQSSPGLIIIQIIMGIK